MARIHTHSGEVLREELMKPLGLSADASAFALRVRATRIGDVLRTEKPRAVTTGDYRDPGRALFRHHRGILARRDSPSPCPLPRDGGEVQIGTAIEREVQPWTGLAA